MPVTKGVNDVFNLPMLVLRAFAGIHVRDVQDRLLVRIEHLQDVVSIGSGVEEIPDIEGFQVLVAVQLLVVGVGNGVEFGLVFRHEDWGRIASKIAAGHGNDMHPIAGDEIVELFTQDVVFAGRDVVEFIDGDQPIIKRFDPELLDGEPERRMGADQYLIAALKECADRFDLAAIRSG